jgi:hypothetical protein
MVEGFHFNSVIADDETRHGQCFVRVLAQFALSLTIEESSQKYCGIDERLSFNRPSLSA